MAKSSRSSSLCICLSFLLMKTTIFHPFSRWVSLTHAVGGFLRPDTWRLRACPDRKKPKSGDFSIENHIITTESNLAGWWFGTWLLFLGMSSSQLTSTDFLQIFRFWIHFSRMDPSNRQASARLRGKCESVAGTTPSLVVVTARTIWMGFSTRLYIKWNNNVSSTCIEIWIWQIYTNIIKSFLFSIYRSLPGISWCYPLVI